MSDERAAKHPVDQIAEAMRWHDNRWRYSAGRFRVRRDVDATEERPLDLR